MTPARPSSPRPKGNSGSDPEVADPPAPVPGEPSGTGGVVVGVTGDVVVATGVVVVVTGTVDVVVDVVDVVDVVVVVGADVRHVVGTVTLLSSRVTAPVWARSRPLTEAPVSRVTETSARIVPEKFVVVLSVADDVTCQNTLHAWAPFSRTTLLPTAVVSVDPAWKTQTAFGSPPALSVTAPVSDMLDVAL
jgi:hypothetical protein